ncbi:MAG: DUF5814 domain-containing protein, partial [Promethearchaeota archaeon]
ASGTLEDIEIFHNNMFNNNFSMDSCLKFLKKNNFIKHKRMGTNGIYKISTTPLGKASAESFFTVKKCIQIQKSLEVGINLFDLDGFPEENNNNEDKKSNEKQNEVKKVNPRKKQEKTHKKTIFDDNLPISLALDLHPFRNIYISNSVAKEISSKGQRKTSNLLFNSYTLSMLSAENIGKKKRKLSKFMKDLLSTWTREIFNCGCKESPYCNCGQRNVEKKLLELRIAGNYPDEILEWLNFEWQIKIYKGDLFDYFDGITHNLKSIYKIGKSLFYNNKIDKNIKKDIESIPELLNNLKINE